MSSSEKLAAVLDPKLRGPFSLIVAIVLTVLLVIVGLRQAETFVDGRVDLKLADQRKTAEEQGKRLEKIEDQFAAMKDTLSEIRADVRVLRVRLERADAPRSIMPDLAASPP
jgi:hypothetical protein